MEYNYHAKNIQQAKNIRQSLAPPPMLPTAGVAECDRRSKRSLELSMGSCTAGGAERVDVCQGRQ